MEIAKNKISYLRKEGVMKGLLLSLTFFFMIFSHAWAMDVYVDYNTTDLSIKPGDKIQVDIRARNVEDLYLIELILYYDPRILDYLSYSMEGSILQMVYIQKEEKLSESEAYVQFVLGMGLGVKTGVSCDDGLLISLIFEVLSYGMSPLDLEGRALNSSGESIWDPSEGIGSTEDGSFNNAIEADFTYSPEEPMATEEVIFDGSSSKSNCGQITSYRWDFGDGATGEGVIITHVYESSGSYTVTLTVVDEAGYTASTSKTITVQEYQLPTGACELVRRSAWPEHHHFVISKDEDGYQELFGKVQNFTEQTYWVKVRFEINGQVVETEPIKLPGGVITGTRKSNIDDLSVLWNDYLPGRRYTVYAYTLYSKDLQEWASGQKVKKFSFAVVE
jgi:hypothetical protein